MWRRCGSVIAVVVLCVWTRPVHAEDLPVEIRAEVMSSLFIDIAGGVMIEGPGRIRLRTSLGALPRGYVRAANAIIQNFEPSYSDETARLVEDSLQSSLVWRTHFGWRPFRQRGFYLHTGYTRMGAGGGATGLQIIEGVGNISVPPAVLSVAATQSLDVSALVHMWDVEIGGEWTVADQLTIRAGLGWSRTFNARTDVQANWEASPAVSLLADQVAAEYEAWLERQIRKWFHPPTLVLAVGYQF